MHKINGAITSSRNVVFNLGIGCKTIQSPSNNLFVSGIIFLKFGDNLLLKNWVLLKFIKTTNMPIFNRVRDKVKLFDSPPLSQAISCEEMQVAVHFWIELFREHRILLSFNEQQTDYKRRYDFIRNVFLDMELPSHPPELYFCFIYDQYTQDQYPEEPETLVCGLLDGILSGEIADKTELINKRVKLNHFHNLSEPELRYLLERHQQRYASISGISLLHEEKKLVGNRLVIGGSHATGFCKTDHCSIRRGKWKVEMLRKEGKWLVSGIYIEGVEF
jgi:hypothetical protein